MNYTLKYSGNKDQLGGAYISQWKFNQIESETTVQFLFIEFSRGRIEKLFRIKISIDLDSLQTHPTSRSILKIFLKNRVSTILFIAPLTEVLLYLVGKKNTLTN